MKLSSSLAGSLVEPSADESGPVLAQVDVGEHVIMSNHLSLILFIFKGILNKNIDI